MDSELLREVKSNLYDIEYSMEEKPGILRQLVTIFDVDDHVGLSFLLAAGLMLSSSAFFFLQVFLVPRRWANSMIVCGLVTTVAWHHYIYMKDQWAETRSAPTVYRYMDWLITVPLQVVEFYLILSAASPYESRSGIGYNLFFRLMFASMLMLGFGYMGETKIMEVWVAFICGLFMWLYVVWEIFLGEASAISNRLTLIKARENLKSSGIVLSSDGLQKNKKNIRMQVEDARLEIVEAIQELEKNGATLTEQQQLAIREVKKPEAQLAFEMLRLIIMFGWSLYPIGYVVGKAGGKAEEDILNAIYNVADLLNKSAFGLTIFYAAGSRSEMQKSLLEENTLPNADEILMKKTGQDLSERFAHDLQQRIEQSMSKSDIGTSGKRSATEGSGIMSHTSHQMEIKAMMSSPGMIQSP